MSSRCELRRYGAFCKNRGGKTLGLGDKAVAARQESRRAWAKARWRILGFKKMPLVAAKVKRVRKLIFCSCERRRVRNRTKPRAKASCECAVFQSPTPCVSRDRFQAAPGCVASLASRFSCKDIVGLGCLRLQRIPKSHPDPGEANNPRSVTSVGLARLNGSLYRLL